MWSPTHIQVTGTCRDFFYLLLECHTIELVDTAKKTFKICARKTSNFKFKKNLRFQVAVDLPKQLQYTVYSL